MAAAEDSPERVDLTGKTIGKYSISRLIGQGGMGRVYEAINPTIQKRVAIKVLDTEYAKNRDAAARFTREAQAASAAESPHIVEIFDAGFTDDGVAYIVMELLQGEPLSERLRREKFLEADEAKRIVTQIARGLVKAHAAGIVHRDLKPDNVFLVDRDPDPPFAKVLDFGVSKVEKRVQATTLTRDGVVLGTPWYMSPEQAQGESDVDARSDIWSVGAMLYECLCGKQPFVGNTYEQIIVKICTSNPVPLPSGLPKDLVDIVVGCLERDRDKRIASAFDLLALLGEPTGRHKAAPMRSVAPARTGASDSVAEAPAVHVKARPTAALPGTRPPRYGMVIGLMALAGAAGALALVLKSRSDVAAGAATAAPDPTASAIESVRVVPTSPILTNPTQTSVSSSARSVELEPVASTDIAVRSAEPSASSTAGPRAVGAGPRPRASTAPVEAPPPAQPTARPKGVAGDLELQRN